ncbi:hypothetical protein CSKR_101098 [Clonorchis sinensis]|uniref:Uncharacterized protein n=1 Tax=Clonorchis sinensis TaxID=79923 RepID=A0A3R7G6J4_CLOSI|nr:hypothetical protein CSKR_101098 [Clonorchis sinensis]
MNGREGTVGSWEGTIAVNGMNGREGTVGSWEGTIAGVLSNWVWQPCAIIGLTYITFRTIS